MFRSFSASYAGHVVDDNIGLAGTPANDRRYSNEELAGTFDWALDIAQHLERLGYTSSGWPSTTFRLKATKESPTC